MSYVLYEKKGHTAYITLNRPKHMNVLGQELSAEVESQFAADDNTWIGICTGAGDRAFCAGRDLKEVAATGDRSNLRERLSRPMTDFGKPTIAAVNGAAYGSRV